MYKSIKIIKYIDGSRYIDGNKYDRRYIQDLYIENYKILNRKKY